MEGADSVTKSAAATATCTSVDANASVKAGAITQSLSAHSDPSKVVWSHATNSQSALAEVLGPSSSVSFIEADIVQPPGEDAEPIMAHPPATESDISFKEFLQRVLATNEKLVKNDRRTRGMKLDFKSPDAVPACMDNLLENIAALKDTSVWLNADIWKGPGGNKSPFRDLDFIAQCTRMLSVKLVTLSLGWTTGGNSEPYTDAHVDAALASLEKLGILCKGKHVGPYHGKTAPIHSDQTQNCKVHDYVLCLWEGEWQAGRVVCVNNTREPREEWADDDTVNVLLARTQNNYAIGLHPHEVKLLQELHAGDKVMAVKGGALWGQTDYLPGRVINVRKNGTYDVEFVDLVTNTIEVEQYMDRSFIRLQCKESTDGQTNNDAAVVTDRIRSSICPVTFPVKASLAAAANPTLWQRLLKICETFTLTIWGQVGVREQAWIGSMLSRFPRRIYVDVQPIKM